MIKPSKKQAEKIAEKYREVEQAQKAFNNYLQGVGDMLELDASKQWNYDFKEGQFIEVKQDV